jgi:hypothetical protein
MKALPRDFFFHQRTGGFYYRPTGERWVEKSIRFLFSDAEIEKIKMQRTLMPRQIYDYGRGQKRVIR